jgi:hypothetical protein
MLLPARLGWMCTAVSLNGNGILRPDAWQGSEIEKAVNKLERETNAGVVGSLSAIEEERLGSRHLLNLEFAIC